MPVYSRVLFSAIALAALLVAYYQAGPAPIAASDKAANRHQAVALDDLNISLADAQVANIEDASLQQIRLQAGLQGSDIDGGFSFNEAGELIFDAKLWRLFDYLNAKDSQQYDFIEQYLTARLSLENTMLGLGYLRLYTSYQYDLAQLLDDDEAGVSADLMASVFDNDSVAEQQVIAQSLDMINAQYDLIDQYFAAQQVQIWLRQRLDYSTIRIKQLRAQADVNLTDEQKLQQVTHLQQNLPSSEQQIYQHWLQTKQYQQALLKLHQAGADKQQVYQLRQQTYGEQAAANLMQVDQQQQAWQQQQLDYQAAVAELDLSVAEDVEQQQRLLEAFSPAQQRRLEAFLIKQRSLN